MKVHDTLRLFRSRSNGSMSVMMAFLLLVLLTAAGGVADLSSAMQQRTEAQRDLDSALLSMFHNPDVEDMSTAQREEHVRDFMSAAFEDFPVDAAIAVTRDGDTYTANADFASNNMILNIVGVDTFDVGVISKVTFARPPPMELALVLDTTSSMAYGDKLGTMQTAARNLVTSLDEFETVKIALVPFARYVNVGTQNRNAAGLDIPEDVPPSERCTSTPDMASSNCRSVDTTCSNQSCSDYMDTCTEDGVDRPCSRQQCSPGPSFQCTEQQCDQTPTGTQTTTCQPVAGVAWKGCVGSREYPGNSLDTLSGGDVPGFLGGSCARPIVRLTDDGASIVGAIDGFATAGETFIAPALLWGARMISTIAPFPDGSADPTVKKAIVLMSDGANTISKTAGSEKHLGTDRSASDILLLEICDALKAKDIVLYTVAYDIDDAAGRQLLSDCASEGRDTFFDARTDAQLVESFDTISRGFRTARVSQ